VVPSLEGRGPIPRVRDSATGALVEAADASLYVCGITPYDATHVGHASTYLVFDTLVRVWLDAGLTVRFTENVTDVDDPLLERATAMGVDWRDLAAGEIDGFRRDMAALRLVPPTEFVAVTDEIGPVGDAVAALLDGGAAYRLGDDIYFDLSAPAGPWRLGAVSGLDRATMVAVAAERGGDPDRAGKRDPLDPLLWRGARAGEPSWPSAVGPGRPGWHIECTVIAERTLGVPFGVNGGGADLPFPHHEFSEAHTGALTGTRHALAHLHAGMVAYRGEKISKSLGNLVLVSALVDSGVDPRAIRLAVLVHHYRDGWEWTEELLATARRRLARWCEWALGSDGTRTSLVAELRGCLSADLGTPAAIAAIDSRVHAGAPPSTAELDAIDALLGVRL
jgi:L-cysteine:1D-myo-inositol 2-amino-2-deoxy-alpha-D-glucopyranoside ligase